MTTIRAFIALELPHEIQGQLKIVLQQLKTNLPDIVRWVAPENLHLTLKFLGDVSPAHLNSLNEILRSIAGNQPTFEVHLGKIGAFPARHRPRVLWVGLEAPTALKTLQHVVEIETQKLGYPPEERPFSPHLTVGRIKQNAPSEAVARAAASLANLPVHPTGSFAVHQLTLFRSDLKPAGAVYTPVAVVPLNQNHEVK